ncbi:MULTISPECIES: hypothetical protein [Aphanothece]|uniref:hypothetical protein n=1 Tax=Aphanothece TaxID=1121 RepID=UPI003985435B
MDATATEEGGFRFHIETHKDHKLVTLQNQGNDSVPEGEVARQLSSLFINRTDSRAQAYSDCYNLGDMLLFNLRHRPESDSKYLSKLLINSKKSLRYPGTIASIYYRLYSEDLSTTRHPCLQGLKQAIDQYTAKTLDGSALGSLTTGDKSLLIHFRLGDQGLVERRYLAGLRDMIERLGITHTYCITGLHNHWVSAKSKGLRKSEYVTQDAEVARATICKSFDDSMDRIFEYLPMSAFIIAEPDIHICLGSRMSHVAIHKGGFSGLLAATAPQNLYYFKNSWSRKYLGEIVAENRRAGIKQNVVELHGETISSE